MICVCGESLVSYPRTLGAPSIDYECDMCGSVWIIPMINLCICGAIDKWTVNSAGYKCGKCGVEIIPEYGERESYIDKRDCGHCKKLRYVIMVSENVFKCLSCATLQEGKVVYTFKKDKDGNISVI